MALPGSQSQADIDRDLVDPIVHAAYKMRIIEGRVEVSRVFAKAAMTDEIRAAAERKLAYLNCNTDVLDRDYISRVHRNILTEALAP